MAQIERAYSHRPDWELLELLRETIRKGAKSDFQILVPQMFGTKTLKAIIDLHADHELYLFKVEGKSPYQDTSKGGWRNK